MHPHPSLDEVAAVGLGGDLEPLALEAHAVVCGDRSLVVFAQHVGQSRADKRHEGTAGLGRGHRRHLPRWRGHRDRPLPRGCRPRTACHRRALGWKPRPLRPAPRRRLPPHRLRRRRRGPARRGQAQCPGDGTGHRRHRPHSRARRLQRRPRRPRAAGDGRAARLSRKLRPGLAAMGRLRRVRKPYRLTCPPEPLARFVDALARVSEAAALQWGQVQPGAGRTNGWLPGTRPASGPAKGPSPSSTPGRTSTHQRAMPAGSLRRTNAGPPKPCAPLKPSSPASHPRPGLKIIHERSSGAAGRIPPGRAPIRVRGEVSRGRKGCREAPAEAGRGRRWCVSSQECARMRRHCIESAYGSLAAGPRRHGVETLPVPVEIL